MLFPQIPLVRLSTLFSCLQSGPHSPLHFTLNVLARAVPFLCPRSQDGVFVTRRKRPAASVLSALRALPDPFLPRAPIPGPSEEVREGAGAKAPVGGGQAGIGTCWT